MKKNIYNMKIENSVFTFKLYKVLSDKGISHNQFMVSVNSAN